jgi:hypothetical protein
VPEAEELRSHLVERYDFRAHTLYTLDQDVTLLRRDDGPNWVARVLRRIRLEPEEVERLAGLLRARPLIFAIWRLRHGSTTASAALEDALETRRLADLLALQVRERLVP